MVSLFKFFYSSPAFIAAAYLEVTISTQGPYKWVLISVNTLDLQVLHQDGLSEPYNSISGPKEGSVKDPCRALRPVLVPACLSWSLVDVFLQCSLIYSLELSLALSLSPKRPSLEARGT